ncbi:MAG: hypothetical protein WBQ65_05730, partial [Bryobacteraceae bacterium]
LCYTTACALDVGQVANLRGGWLPPPVRCGPIANRPQLTTLPHIAASRKRCWRFSAVVAGASKGGRRIDNPPQVENLPHNSSRRAKNMMDSSTNPLGFS